MELDGKPESDVRLKFPSPVISAREVDAQERAIGSAMLSQGTLEANFGPYEPKTFAVRLAGPSAMIAKPAFVHVPLH